LTTTFSVHAGPFGGDPDFFAGETGFFERDPDFFFVPVHCGTESAEGICMIWMSTEMGDRRTLGRVDMVEPDVDGLVDLTGTDVLRDLP